jgi:hypothetical protein
MSVSLKLTEINHNEKTLDWLKNPLTMPQIGFIILPKKGKGHVQCMVASSHRISGCKLKPQKIQIPKWEGGRLQFFVL